MSIDYRDRTCNRPVDQDGYELPPWLNPHLCDYNAELAALPVETTGFEPSADDIAWVNEHPVDEPEWEPSAEDWADYHEYCLEQERIDALRRMEDHEYEARCRYAL